MLKRFRIFLISHRSIRLKQYNYLIVTILFLTFCTSTYAEILETKFAYIGNTGHAAYKGASQGMLEANLQGEFLNLKYSMDNFTASNYKEADLKNYIAVFTQVDKATLNEISTSYPNTPVFNLTLKDNDLRYSCSNNILHTAASNKMLNDAKAQWQKKNSNSDANAQAWHPDFKKFAAKDLNKRFKKFHNQKMNSDAWAGWAAVKMTSDTIARTKISTSENMLNYLKNDLGFDGQKGSDMNFRETGQLRQLILLIENDRIVAEAPVRGFAKPPTLDSLGILNCEK